MIFGTNKIVQKNSVIIIVRRDLVMQRAFLQYNTGPPFWVQCGGLICSSSMMGIRNLSFLF